jgi:hypothetical protein
MRAGLSRSFTNVHVHPTVDTHEKLMGLIRATGMVVYVSRRGLGKVLVTREQAAIKRAFASLNAGEQP